MKSTTKSELRNFDHYHLVISCFTEHFVFGNRHEDKSKIIYAIFIMCHMKQSGRIIVKTGCLVLNYLAGIEQITTFISKLKKRKTKIG